jgi:hypothetical protein
MTLPLESSSVYVASLLTLEMVERIDHAGADLTYTKTRKTMRSG